jgi:hypothetical protein
MTVNYEDYRRALLQLKELPSRTAADLEHAKQTRAQADALADKAVSSADDAAADTLKAIEAHLTASRAALEPLGRSNLVPPHIRPSGGIATATRDDVAKAQQGLAAAVNALRQIVKAEIQRIESENERLAREGAERERLAREAAARVAAAAARRKKLIRLGAVGTMLLVVLIVILIVIL